VRPREVVRWAVTTPIWVNSGALLRRTSSIWVNAGALLRRTSPMWVKAGALRPGHSGQGAAKALRRGRLDGGPLERWFGTSGDVCRFLRSRPGDGRRRRRPRSRPESFWSRPESSGARALRPGRPWAPAGPGRPHEAPGGWPSAGAQPPDAPGSIWKPAGAL
jgi:hypothetical protein